MNIYDRYVTVNNVERLKESKIHIRRSNGQLLMNNSLFSSDAREISS